MSKSRGLEKDVRAEVVRRGFNYRQNDAAHVELDLSSEVALKYGH
jgi:hypothetical protein